MKELQKLLSKIRQATEHYEMISNGDRIAVGVSGGKDSLALLFALAKLKEFYPHPFDLCAISVDLGFTDTDIYAPIRSFAGELGIEYHIIKTEIADIIFNERKEKNPCSLCSKMRRGALVDTAVSLGANKVALGHHLDDTVETFMMSLMHEGRVSCFCPVTVYDDKQISVIRPLVYARETEVSSLARKLSLPIVKNPCPKDGHSEREEMKNYLRMFDKSHRGLYTRLLGAIEREELEGWHI